MKKRAGVLIINPEKDCILLIHRIRNSLEYWVIPGGTVEDGESFEEAAKREIMEELGIKMEGFTEFFSFSTEDREERYYLTKIMEMKEYTIQGEEKERSGKDNQYLVKWVNLNQLSNIDLKPLIIKNEIILSKARGII
ncbi:NUDIX hydrolase [Weizmannia acidilactici]|uniref:NUDIX hydrolase n=1 Tax=Weizmannia acidilactici TaxID=2607726 RepID=UPI00124C12F0|nr:NUDIX domain-containing protein [Weizmannia acidilactici]GER68688.1 hypothetical protein BpJC4_31590 [Weizmannia acidilactici]GER75196.1 hypothetical protein BpPP18_32630 [Weizmannia acidilactici]